MSYEKCRFNSNRICSFCFKVYGELFCGIANPKKHKTNRIKGLRKCPKEKE